MKRSSMVFAAGFVVAFCGGDLAAQQAFDGTTSRVNGTDLHYRVLGAGPPLLLLHWFGTCGAVWQPHLERLSKEYRLIVADLPAHGRSTNPPGGFTHRNAAKDMFALLDQLGIERIKAIGLSSGGMTLLHMATQQPERVEAMVLVGATTEFGDEARAIMRRSHPDSLTAAELKEWGECSARGEEQTRDVLLQFHRYKDSYDDMNFTAPYLSTIAARTLIVHGDRDEFFPVEIPFRMYRAIPNASLWIVPGGGHIPAFGSMAAAFQEEALAFLRTPSRRPR